MNLETLLVLITCLADTTILSSQDVQHIEQGGELVINADTPPPPDSSILWKINADKVVEYDKDYPDQDITAYGTFKDRVTLDRTTGELKVTSLTNADNGVYSVEYDSKPQPKSFKVSVFNQDVKKPLKWGGELVIKADTPPPPGSSILWRSNSNKVVEYDKDYPSLGIISYGAFKDRVTLDRTTGELKVTSLTNADNGVYSVKYDNKLQPKTFPVSVFKNVPKPTITHSCNENLTSCTLTCVGDTTDTGVVTYSWKKDREPLTISEQTMQITSKEPANFTCQFCNSMSEEESEPLKNPLHQSGFNYWLMFVCVPFLVLAILAGICIPIYRRLRRVRYMIPYLPRPFAVTTNYTHSTPRRYMPVATTDSVVVVGSGAGNDEGDNDTLNTNNGNVIEVAMVQLSGAAGEAPLNTANIPDLHDNTEDRQDNGNTDPPTEPKVDLPLIDEVEVHSDLHEDVSVLTGLVTCLRYDADKEEAGSESTPVDML